MDLREIVWALGGELYDGGRRANIPAPGHSARDRSVSLLLERGRVVVHTFGDSDWRAVLDQLRAHRLIGADNALSSGPGVQSGSRPAREPASACARLDVALRLWDAGRPLGRSLAAGHCRVRGLTGDLPGPEALRFGPNTPVSVYRPRGSARPALLAGIQDAAGRYCAVEVTYLTQNARRALDLRLPRKTVGVPLAGCAVRLAPAAAQMLVAEGVFTTLSASEWFGLPGWALQSTRNLRAWSPPDGVRSVLIAADRGRDGEVSAERLRERLVKAGLKAKVVPPPAPWGDWNDWSTGAGADAETKDLGRDGAGAPRGRMILAQALEPDPDDRSSVPSR